MSDRVLWQAEIDVALAERVHTARKKFRLSNAEMTRAALEALCTRLESAREPFGTEPSPEQVQS